MGKTILVIEDDSAIRRVLQLELEHEGYRVLESDNGGDGLALILEGACDLVLLDLMIPVLNGLELCRRVRSSDTPYQNTPIIMLTARDTVMDRVSGLDRGANDYIVKPFEIEELLARVRVQLRANPSGEASQQSTLSLDDLVINMDSRIVTLEGDPLILTKTEFDLLAYLLRNRSRVISKDILMQDVWDQMYFEDTNLVEVYVAYLRKKLGQYGKRIETVRGVGYVIR